VFRLPAYVSCVSVQSVRCSLMISSFGCGLVGRFGFGLGQTNCRDCDAGSFSNQTGQVCSILGRIRPNLIKFLRCVLL
jgi:hypothetical protein